MTAAVCVLAAAALPAAPASAADDTRRFVVVYDSGPRAAFPVQAETAARERALGFESRHRFRHTIDGFSARLTPAQARALRRDPDVALVAADRKLHAARVPVAPNDTVPKGVARIGGSTDAGVHAAASAAVAVIDTGIDLTHPDLDARAGVNCVGSRTLPPRDDDGHGTFVAGVLAARNNGTGIVGVAPGTTVYAVKALNATGAGFIDDIICGIEWVTAHAPRLGIRVVNMSLSGAERYEPLHRAIQSATRTGLVFTVAAGNSAADIANEIPGSYPEVLTVTAMSDTDGRPGSLGLPCEDDPLFPELDDTASTFSNFATAAADGAHVVAAPGACIESTDRGGALATWSGTSAAAPHVAGIVALCMGEAGAAGPCADMTAAEVIEQVRADAAANATPQSGFAGDPFHPDPGGAYFGHLASAADLTVRRIPRRPASQSAAAAPAELDRVLEVLTLRIRRRQRVGELSVAVRLAEPGTVTAAARVRLRGRRAAAARVVVARRASAQVQPRQTVRLRLRFTRAGLKRVQRALRRGIRLRARVTMTVSDAAANARTKTGRVRLRR